MQKKIRFVQGELAIMEGDGSQMAIDEMTMSDSLLASPLAAFDTQAT